MKQIAFALALALPLVLAGCAAQHKPCHSKDGSCAKKTEMPCCQKKGECKKK